MSEEKERIKQIGKTLDLLEGLKEVEKQEKKNKDKELDLKILKARAKVKQLRSQKKTIRVRGRLVPNDVSIDQYTGKPIKED
jgi:hypothetical protein